jgi:hypothetical protein
MSGLGDGARNRGDVRPRKACPWCGRSTAVTFNKRTGEAYLRSHNDTRDRDANLRCVGSTRTVSRDGLR